MKLPARREGIEGPPIEEVFYLRQRDSELFWDGTRWAGAERARRFGDLDHALCVAGRAALRRVDLMVSFPTRNRSLIIPLGPG